MAPGQLHHSKRCDRHWELRRLMCMLLFQILLYSSVPSQTSALIRSPKLGPASKLLPPEPAQENQNGNGNSVKYFAEKNYTVNDFHQLVEGLNTDLKTVISRVDDDVARNISSILQRVWILEERVSSSSTAEGIWKDYCAFCGWTSDSSQGRAATDWICMCLSVALVVVVAVGLAFFAGSLLIYFFRREASEDSSYQKKRDSMDSRRQKLLPNV